jgi:hypothetical protein
VSCRGPRTRSRGGAAGHALGVDPALLRGNLALALFILLLALIILPSQDRASGAFVVTVLAVVVALLFIAAIWLLTRWLSPRLPPKEDDK